MCLSRHAIAGTRYTVNGGFGDNTYHLAIGSGDLETFDSPITINGNVNLDELTLYDQNSPFGPDYQITETSIDRDFFGEPNLISPEIGVTFTAMDDVTLHMNGGNNTVEIASTTANLTLNAAAGDDDFQVGIGVLEDLSGLVTINAGGGTDEIQLHDQTDSGDDKYSIGGNFVAKLGFNLTYNDAEALTLDANPFSNLINVESVLQTTPVWINGGGRSDTIHIAPTAQDLSVIQAAVFVNGGSGVDNIVLHDELSNPLDSLSFGITYDSVTRPINPLFNPRFELHYTETERLQLQLGEADDLVDIMSTAPGMHVVVETGGRGHRCCKHSYASSTDARWRCDVDLVELLGTAASEEVSFSAGFGSADVNLIDFRERRSGLHGRYRRPHA